MADYTFRTKINRPTKKDYSDDPQRILVTDITQLEQCILDLKARIEALEP